MKKDIKPQYKMATTAIHLTGDISRTEVDICTVFREDDDNYYGNWVYGFGFIDVAFPKATTRDLTPEEVEEYHGAVMNMAGMPMVINITGEDFRKHVVVTRESDGKVHTGTLVTSLKPGRAIVMTTDNGRVWNSSAIQSVDANGVKTRNSTYKVEYV